MNNIESMELSQIKGQVTKMEEDIKRLSEVTTTTGGNVSKILTLLQGPEMDEEDGGMIRKLYELKADNRALEARVEKLEEYKDAVKNKIIGLWSACVIFASVVAWLVGKIAVS